MIPLHSTHRLHCITRSPFLIPAHIGWCAGDRLLFAANFPYGHSGFVLANRSVGEGQDNELKSFCVNNYFSFSTRSAAATAFFACLGFTLHLRSERYICDLYLCEQNRTRHRVPDRLRFADCLAGWFCNFEGRIGGGGEGSRPRCSQIWSPPMMCFGDEGSACGEGYCLVQILIFRPISQPVIRYKNKIYAKPLCTHMM